MSYIAFADNEAEELRTGLSEDDVARLRADLEALGVSGWFAWVAENQREATDYLRATEKQRARLKKWREPQRRLRLILNAYQQARLAAAMLDAKEKLVACGPFREVVADAALFAIQICREAAWYWPFEGAAPPKGWPVG